MRIVFFEFVPHYGGGARSNLDLAKGLREHVEVSIVDPYGSSAAHVKAVREAGLDFHVPYPESKASYIGGHGRNPLIRAMQVLASVPNLLVVRSRTKALMKRLRPSVVVCNSFKAAMVLSTVPALREVPLTMLLQGWLPFMPQNIPRYGKRFCRGRCAAILAISRATKAALLCSGIDSKKMHVLHNSIDVDETLALADRPLGAALPQAGRAVRILLPAGIMRAKGQHTAVHAMRGILDAGHDAVLWIAGDHQPIGANKYYLDETKALAEQLGVAERVEWLGLRDDIPQLMKAATVVILPSHSEGHPRVVLEAMALAKPVAATPVGGIMDMILPGVTGLYFEVDDDAGLAACVDRLANDPAQADRMGRTAQEYIRMNFRAQDQISRALRIFRQVSK